MSGDLLSSGISAGKFSFKKFEVDKKQQEAAVSSNYNYFSQLQAQVNGGDVEASQQAMAVSLFSIPSDVGDGAKNLEKNNSILLEIQAKAKNVVNKYKEEQANGQSGQGNQRKSLAQNGILPPSKENIEEIKKILAEQGDDDITEEDIQIFLETNPEFSE